MSVPSSNTTVTTDSPYLVMERTSSTLGIPDMARSTGTLTYCSTSIGDSAGAGVITWTCTLVMSGTASIGSSTAECTPMITSNTVSSSTTARWRSDQATTPDRNFTSVLLAERALEDGALEREHAVDDDLLAGAQAAQDLDAPAGGAAGGDGVKLEVAVGLAHEHHVRVRHLGHRRERDDHAFGARLGVADHDAGSAEQAHLDQIAVVADQDARGDGASGRIDLTPDGLDRRFEHLVRVGVQAHLGAGADLHARQIRLEQAAEEVRALQIADDGDDVLGLDGLALHGVAGEDEARQRRADGDARASPLRLVRALAERAQRLLRGRDLGVQRRGLRRRGGDLLARREVLALEVPEPIGVQPRHLRLRRGC